jgi:hypothetical protein
MNKYILWIVIIIFHMQTRDPKSGKFINSGQKGSGIGASRVTPFDNSVNRAQYTNNKLTADGRTKVIMMLRKYKALKNDLFYAPLGRQDQIKEALVNLNTAFKSVTGYDISTVNISDAELKKLL